MTDMRGLPGNIVFANIASWISCIIVLAAVWAGFVLLFGGWIGGLTGWIPGMILAVGSRILMFFLLEMAEDFISSSRTKFTQFVDSVPDKHWKWWLLGIMLAPTALIAALFALFDNASRP